MSERTPQVLGREWEREFAASLGGKPVPGSGAFFQKLDVHQLGIVWGLRWHGNSHSFTVSDSLMTEALQAIYAPGGVGGLAIPALAFKTLENEFVVFRKFDALTLMTQEQGASIATARSQDVVDRTKRLPEFLR